MKSVEVFQGLKGQNNNVVLISDGIESCDGDSCNSRARCRRDRLKVHVIGFGLTPDQPL
jgi:hypothetical protein